MGGKQKQAQRTKNNARPSSSSRSAEILGNTVPNFVGFSAAKDGGGLVAVVPGFSIKEEINSNIDPNFQMVLKKFGKKDPVTKLKALSEYATLVNNSEESIVCDALSLWPRFYCQLSSDGEHRIREGAQVAHGAVVKKCGRSIAPYLKQLIPVWITSQYDTYVPAAMQAQAALEAVFPANKLPDVLGFCKVEITTFIIENLTVHTSASLPSSKNSTPEETESRFERIIISSLRGYSLMIHHLPEAHLDWLCEQQVQLLDNDKFWNYGNHKVPQIRTSCYGVIGELCQRFGSWFGPKYGSKAANLVLNHLNDKELNVTLSAWENAIVLMANIPDCFKLVQFDSKVLPAICETLSAGCWGSAGKISPLMLPFLARIPSDSLTPHTLDMFFDAILQGAKQRCVVSSKSECTLWMNGLAECIRFISVDSNKTDTRLQSLSKITRQWLLYILRSHLSINPFTPLKVSVPFLADLIKYWIKQSLSSQCAGSVFYVQLLRLFWQNVVFVMNNQLQEFKIENESDEMANVHYEFFVGLKNNSHSKSKKKNLRVKFDSDEKPDGEIAEISEKFDEQQISVESQIKQVYDRDLSSVVNEVCGLYLTLAKEKCISAPILTPLHSLILEFDSQQLFNNMLKAVIKHPEQTIYDLYSGLFFNWLKGDAMRSQAVVDITFSLFTYLNDEQQGNILKSFDQFPHSVIKWCVSRCISFPYKQMSSIKEWLHGDLVNKALVSLTQLVAKEGDTHIVAFLKMCFAQDDDGGILLSAKSCSDVLKVLQVALSDYDSIHLDTCSSFAAQLATTLCYSEKLQGFDDFLLTLLKINCSIPPEGSDVLTDDTWLEVKTSWQDALSTFEWNELLTFITSASDIIFDYLSKKDISLVDNSLISGLVDLSFSLLHSGCKTTQLNEANIDNLCFMLKILMKINNEHIESWFKDVYSKSLMICLLNGSLDCINANKNIILSDIISNSKSNDSVQVSECDLGKLLVWSEFCTMLVDKVFESCTKKENDGDNEGDDEENEDNSSSVDLDAILQCEGVNIILGNIIYNTVVLKVLYKDCKSLQWFNTLSKFYSSIENTIRHTITLLPEPCYVQLVEYIKSKALNDGLLWLISLELCTSVRIQSREIAESDYFDPLIQFSKREESSEDYMKRILMPLLLPESDWKILKSNESLLSLSGVLALRSIYLCQIRKIVDVSLSIEEFMNNIDKPLATLTLIIDKYYQCKELMLYDADINKKNWEIVSCNTAIIRFLNVCVTQFGWDLESHQWDFINITISSMMQTLDKSKNAWNTIKVSLMSCEVFKLFHNVDKFIGDVPSECLKREPRQCISNLPQEWMDIFSPHVHEHLIEIICRIFENFSSMVDLTIKDIFYINSLHLAMQRFTIKFLLNNKKHSVDSLMNHCLEIFSAHTPYLLKYMSREMMIILTPSLIETDKVASNTNIATEESEGVEAKLSVYKMVKALTHLEECVDVILSPYLVGESNCILLPFTDSYNIILGYLTLWETILNIVQESITYLQYQYTEFFREGKYVEHLVCAIFKLIPDDSQLAVNNYFKNPPKLILQDAPNSEIVSGMACKCLVQSLRVGAVHVGIRGWWGALPSRMAQHVERIVRIYITPILVQYQLNEVTTRQRELPNVEFSIHPSVNEVVCKYTVDSTKMELTIELCSNHPLGIPKVTSCGGPTSNVAWITLFLSHQNGTLWQTIILWLNSIQKKLDSVSECYVCYCKLHPVTGKLPKISCQTCKNKSHSVCLKKWFSTSGKSTCPLCRSVITLK